MKRGLEAEQTNSVLEDARVNPREKTKGPSKMQTFAPADARPELDRKKRGLEAEKRQSQSKMVVSRCIHIYIYMYT